jgi:hypothetical protein
MPTTYAIPDGRAVMASTLYTGDGATSPSSQAVINTLGFQPDLVWIKSRSNAYPNFLWDVIRGVTNDAYLVTESTGAQNSDATGNQMSSFNSNGFSVQNTTGGSVGTNNSGSTFVGWQWKGGGTGVSNTNGSITSTVSANTTAGFSVVRYTGNNSAGATVGHGLGAIPKLIIVKSTGSENWAVYSSALGTSNGLLLNSSGGQVASAWWNGTSPTSSVFSLSSSSGITNSNGQAYAAYCFAEIAGYSSISTYVGNGSADGPFVYTGFRPAFILYKRNGSGNWVILDTSRNPYNVASNRLFPSLSNAEVTNTIQMDILSNGFKIRVDGTTDAGTNANGDTYIYMAFAENPFKYANAR